MEITTRGTKIKSGKRYRQYVNNCAEILESSGFEELLVPSLDFAERYRNKMGKDIDNEMYVFSDKSGRELCLRPEVTATFQAMYNEREKDKKFWYFERCWRYERPQMGRYREFYQLGVEILNPSKDYQRELLSLAEKLVSLVTTEYNINVSAQRGLSYYIGDGFEISCEKLGAQKQVVGGGRYKEGIGFAIGVDRLLLVNNF